MSSARPLVEAKNLALPPVMSVATLALHRGELVALVGPNGSGKTSLLRALAGVEGSRGTVRIEGEDRDHASPVRRSALLSLAPASRDLPWPIAVGDMLTLSLQPVAAERRDALLDALELAPLVARKVDSLSTGERARVIVGRTLAPSPRLLLLDEPLANLDPFWVLRLLEILRSEVDAAAGTALVAVHDLSLLHRFDRVLVMVNGRIEMDEAPARLMADERFLAAFRLVADPAGPVVRPWADQQSSR